ncbi:ATP-dependent helicase [Schinkia azotoformans]|uniref:DNA 3'-5' helicase n=1 Tax=Schinkia azotoformans LMG 9581 TaxID=1131731 RepID=K6DV08_SCHAZ|nr:ATP-dependent helicase [Schinkia azotoformans]EKN64656.1 UvrD/REP helicase [Schinkia azotoformans LMG 9581]MEC1640031.1 ATP-dependent helicase [Schinkia azotoformans]MEC1943469.1 ATP-dependent helicase [Schinkia azotoformans]MED4354869.1 ATP-dependent helicase [Schinkia azotoformans]
MNGSNDFFERKKQELGVSLNEIQRKAVLQTEGPLLLLASPGSGKTTTIIMRIGYLIEVKGVNPTRIKAVTFSRASAIDMKERFKRFFPELPPVDFSTIHGLAFQVVRDYFRKAGISYRIIEGDLDVDLGKQGKSSWKEQPLHKKIILRNLFQSIVRETITEDQMDELTTYISFIKNKMLSKEKWSTVKVDVPEAERIFEEYEAFKKSGYHQLLLDFDDMLTIANQALKEDSGLLQAYQGRYDYFLTDESQDTSMVQHAIIEKLVQKHGNLCVVADDDQSIYSWRGAEPSYLLNFKQVYPNAEILFMEQNYRSSKGIVDAANQFIKRNKNRYDKNMFTENPAEEPIQIRSLPDYIYQAKYLVQKIQDITYNLREVAILYRNNSSSIALMNEFDRAGIPFFMKDADNRFFSHWVVQDILNFMRMTYTDKRPDILEKIHLKFNGYISKKQMAALKEINNNESVFDNLIKFVEIQDYQVKPLKESKETFQQMKGMPPLHAIQVIRDRLGYEKTLEKMCERLGFRKDNLLGILNTLEEIADGLESMEEFASRLKSLEAELKKAKSRKGQNAVTFSTFHSAKGLEFEWVYMIDLVDGIIPSSDDYTGGTVEGDAIEEATRLFYVGMTRAKKHLELIGYKERDGEKTQDSLFVSYVKNIIDPPPTENIKEDVQVKKKIKVGNTTIPYNPNAIKDQAELVEGREVKHRVFGHGEIVKLSEDTIEVRFQTGVKNLSVSTCLELGLLEPA